MKLEDDYRIYLLRDPRYWGPKFWDFLYLTVLGFPITLSSKQTSDFAALFKSLHHFLPCIECRFHYFHMIRSKTIAPKTREEALDTLLDIHNTVRKRLKKREFGRDEVIKHFYRERWMFKIRDFECWAIISCIALMLYLLFRRNK
jgi:hypothetical protein